MHQDLGDHVQQLSSARDDRRDAVTLLGRDVAKNPVTKNLRVRDDGGERSAQVVRDVGEKLRLQRVALAQVHDETLRLDELRLERLYTINGVLERKRCARGR